MLHPLFRPADPASDAWPEQAFILSLPRTGSTLLRLLLDTHPDVCCPAELYLGRLSEALFHSVHYSVGQTFADDSGEATVRGVVRNVVNAMMQSYATAKGKRLWVEKTPANLQHADVLAATFPRAAFICLHRDPLDTLRSGFESARFGKLNAELWDYRSGCEFYVNETRRLLEFERRHANACCRVRYEELVADPARALHAVCRFLQIDPDAAIVDQAFVTPHERGPGDVKAICSNQIYESSIGRGLEIGPLLATMPASLLADLEQIAEALGYTIRLDGDAGPSSADTARDGASRLQSVDDVFRTYVPARLREQPRLGGVAKLVVHGAGGGSWTVNLNAAPPTIESGGADADCVITMSAENLLELARGRLSIGECYLQAKLKLSGNEAVALSLGRALFG